ncbi:MAG: RNA 2',3'-cyclic phosphodiesterase [Bacteroidales bacterium]|jgi:2'-5' RNA ligase|nr:RNA 2',3'-cyclic phosphodiesterase [Bacteroidales bacterium]
MKRLFVAVPVFLDAPLRDLFVRVRAGCKYDNIVWVREDLLHLTARFIGATSEYRIPMLKQILEQICVAESPFTLTIDKISIFGSRYAPKVIWIGFQEFECFKKLFLKIEDAIVRAEFPAAEGHFVPHITIGRIKKIDNKKRFQQVLNTTIPFPEQTLFVNEIMLFQSKLHSSGPEYKILARFPLGTSKI